ncbi:hypothetical protein M0804_008841 [Polistes exclamans]|nr:hypothetical protein M0804_008841 [Polistes exclamans]
MYDRSSARDYGVGSGSGGCCWSHRARAVPCHYSDVPAAGARTYTLGQCCISERIMVCMSLGGKKAARKDRKKERQVEEEEEESPLSLFSSSDGVVGGSSVDGAVACCTRLIRNYIFKAGQTLRGCPGNRRTRTKKQATSREGLENSAFPTYYDEES